MIKLSDYFKGEDRLYFLVDDKTEQIPKDCATPVVVFRGDPLDSECSFELYCEGELLCHPIDIMQAFSLLLAAYYIFNVDYSKRCKYTLTFLQNHVMKINDAEPITAGLRTVINRLS